jgi:hypothetical protein
MSPVYPTYPPDQTVALLIPGVTTYLLGGLNVNLPTCRMVVTSVAISSNVATIGVTIVEGNIPPPGSYITVRGTLTDGGAANVFGVITVVNINAFTGQGFISYAATGTNQAITPDVGSAYVPVIETTEALIVMATRAVAIPDYQGQESNGLTVTWETLYPSAPSGVTVQLQAALVNQPNEYATLDTSTTVGGEIRAITLTRYNFLRANITSVTGGTNPVGIIKVTI